MTEHIDQKKDFLLELYNQTEGDEGNQVSMHDIGMTMGIERTETSVLAEDLMVDGLIDLQSLAGNISITSAGLDYLQQQGASIQVAGHHPRLSDNLIADNSDREAIEQATAVIKAELAEKAHSYEGIADVVIDMKTLETQLLSHTPKMTILRAVLGSLNDSMTSLGCQKSTETLKKLLG